MLSGCQQVVLGCGVPERVWREGGIGEVGRSKGPVPWSYREQMGCRRRSDTLRFCCQWFLLCGIGRETERLVGGNGGRPTEVLRGKLARGGKGLTGPQGEDSLRRGGMCHCLQKMWTGAALNGEFNVLGGVVRMMGWGLDYVQSTKKFGFCLTRGNGTVKPLCIWTRTVCHYRGWLCVPHEDSPSSIRAPTQPPGWPLEVCQPHLPALSCIFSFSQIILRIIKHVMVPLIQAKPPS